MKRLVSLLLTFCMCLSIGVMLVSCDEEHNHTYKTEWSKDETHHWYDCEGENCTEASEKAKHTWNDGEITTPATSDADGMKTFTCTVCGQTKTETVEYVPEEPEHIYKTEWSKDETHHWHDCKEENCIEASEKAEHTWNDGEITTPATPDANGTKTFTCTVCGQTQIENVVYVPKTTVTEEEWKTILAKDNFNNVTVVMFAFHESNGVTTKSDVVLEYDGDWMRMTMEGESVVSANDYETGGFSSDQIASTVSLGIDLYREFVYDENQKAYVGTISASDEKYRVVYWFENGKLIKARYYEADNEGQYDENRYQELRFSKYGTTEVTPPQA